jgi:immunity protein, SdpI family
MRRMHLASLTLTAISFAIVFYFYDRLPDPMPTHWNAHGQVDGWTSKPWGALMLPLVQVGVWLTLMVVPSISPRGFRLEPFRATYGRLALLMVAFFTALNGVIVWQVLGAQMQMGRMMLMLLGGLLVGVGNYLGKTTPNFFVGIRTPWTLASPEVWSRTHRLGGWLFVAVGLVVMLVAAVTARAPEVLLLVLVAALVPAAYSFVIYRRLVLLKPEGDETPPAPGPPPAT